MTADCILERVNRAFEQVEFATLVAARYVDCSKGYLVSLRTLGGDPAFHRRFKRKEICVMRTATVRGSKPATCRRRSSEAVGSKW
jgi:hypothetical protein